MRTDPRQYLRFTKDRLAEMLARAVDEHRERLEAAQKYGREQHERAEALEERLAVGGEEYARAEMIDRLVDLLEARVPSYLDRTPDEDATIREADALGGASGLRRREESMDDRCWDCVDKVVEDPGLLIGAAPEPRWTMLADGKRHWVRDGAAVCGGPRGS